jgi:hypothetical protein
MKVYIVSRGYKYEGSCVESVFASLEAACKQYSLDSTLYDLNKNESGYWILNLDDVSGDGPYLTISEHEVNA